MKLTLEQAATRLGKSRRQVLYAIRKGDLPAEKLGGRWFIDSADLPLAAPRREAQSRKRRQLRAAVEEALELSPDEGPGRRYSVRELLPGRPGSLRQTGAEGRRVPALHG